jgi:hypothetical protein
MITSVGFTPLPSSWKLQRTQGPRSGMPWRFFSGGLGGGVSGTARPWMWIRFWSLGQVTW